MSIYCKTEKELSDALKNDASQIIIDYNLKEGVLKIQAAGSVAWAVALGTISVALATVVVPGINLIHSLSLSTVLTSIFGLSGSALLASLVYHGGIKLLHKIKAYKSSTMSDGRLLLEYQGN